MTMIFGKALIISKIAYYLPILSAENRRTLAPLRKSYHRALRVMCGALYGTPNTLLYSQTGLAPLHLLIEDANRRLYGQLMKNPTSLLTVEFEEWTTENYHGSPLLGLYRVEKSLPTELTELPLACPSTFPTDSLQSLYLSEFRISGNRTSAEALWKLGGLIPKNQDLYIYTDGSYKLDHTNSTKIAGAGYFVWDAQGHELIARNYKVSPPTDSYHSETLALHSALADLSTEFEDLVRHKSLCFLSDSKSLLSHLNAISLTLNPRSHGEIIEIAISTQKLMQSGCKVSFCWIPGHSGIPGNERADSLAGTALNSGRELCSQLQFSTYRQWARRTANEQLAKELAKGTLRQSNNTFAAKRSRFQNICAPAFYNRR